MSTLYLLVGIEIASDNQWGRHARKTPTFQNVFALPTLQERLARHGVRPTYVVTYPVVTTPGPARVIADLAARGDCEIGALHHSWETPPCSATDVPRCGYASNLPPAQFEQQLERLTEVIARIVGRPPVSYRSGRLGLSAVHVSALEHMGYRVDSSVAPLVCKARDGGPDFIGAPLRPYYLAYDDARMPGSSSVLEVPVTTALDRRVPDWMARAYARAASHGVARRLLGALRVAKMVWLRPSCSSLADMSQLARRLQHDLPGVLNIVFHSSDAIVGGSPTSRTETQRDRLLDILDSFLVFALESLDAVPLTFSEFQSAWCIPRTAVRADRRSRPTPPGMVIGA